MPGSPRLGARLYVIADAECLGTEPDRFAECLVAMASGGAEVAQLRLKPADPRLASDDTLRVQMIERSLEALGRAGLKKRVQLWLDDRADLAAVFSGEFAGVHVGQRDLTPRAVRSVFESGDSPWPLVGLSCHDLEQVRAADADPDVDWLAIGPVFATTSKANPDPVVALEGVHRARAATAKPLVAIGGLDEERLPDVLAAGADAAVVLSALLAGGRDPAEIEATTRKLLAAAGSFGSSVRGLQSTGTEHKR